MGLIKAISGAASGVIADQWKEYFYCEAIPSDVLVKKGMKKVTGRSSNTKGADNVITNGSAIAVADGQCMIIVDNGKVTELCAETGVFTYDSSTEPSIFDGGKLSANIKAVFKNIGKRFTFGGEAATDQRIYYFNTKEIVGNKYGTPSPVPFRIVDQNIGINGLDISVKCFGEYSYRVTNPILFYTNVCGNVANTYSREEIDSMLKTELLTALQEAFFRIGQKGVYYSAIPGHTTELADELNDVLSSKWRDLRGIEIISFGVSSIKATEEDEKMIKELQRNAAFKDPAMAAAHMTGATAAAMQAAANNQGAGSAMAFMGMNMAQQAGGVNAQSLYQMAQQNQAAQAATQTQASASAADSWTCTCGNVAHGNFCTECGAKKPAADGWTCPTCGKTNKGKFCSECGAKKPAGIPQYRCDKCGWEPEDPTKPPKFCPECGDPFGDEDII